MAKSCSQFLSAVVLGFAMVLAGDAIAAPVNYDIVYVRQPRFGDNNNTIWPEVFHPARLDPGADLMLLHTNGTEEVLIAGGNGGVTDPFLSFDGQWCYYVYFPDLRQSALNFQRGDLPYQGCDIYKIHLTTRQIVALTFQDSRPTPAPVNGITQISNGDLVVVDYYNLNNNGFGALYRLPPTAPPGQPQFYNAFGDGAPGLDQTIGNANPFHYPFILPFQPRGMYAMTPFTHPQDEAAPVGAGGVRVGKFTHPSGAPNNDLLVVWTPGPANDLTRPTTIPYYDAGLYLNRASCSRALRRLCSWATGCPD